MTYDPYNNEISNHNNGVNIYKTLELSYPEDKDKFYDYIIPILKSEYGIVDELSDKIKNVNSDRKMNLEKFLIRYKTPNPLKDPQKKHLWLKNTRSKFPELLARDLLTKKYKVKFPCRVSLEEEDPDMPKRGIDNFGFIFSNVNNKISLDYIVACEVKASDEKCSPPSVVHAKKDSLFNSLKSISLIDERFCKAIASAIDKLPVGEYVELITSLAIDLETSENLDGIKKKIILAPFLLRKGECWTEADYGKFMTNCNEINCCSITYYIITLDYGLTEFADEVFEKLRDN